MSESPGWDAIDAALTRVYGDVEPHHWGTVVKRALGGSDPLDGISVYPRTEPVPHWHFVSYGMTELYEKTSENLAESGWGFEFTFRLARDPAETTPPLWAAGLLQNLGRYVFTSGNRFEPGHHMNTNGPIAADRADCAVRALAFALDPELGEISTPHGRVRFLQAVGLTIDEYETANRWRPSALLDTLAPGLPLLVTDIDRVSFLDDPETAALVRAGIERDGSGVGAVYIPSLDWEAMWGGLTLRFGALQAPAIARALRGRLAHGNDLTLQGEEKLLFVEPSEEFWVELSDDRTVLSMGVTPVMLDEMTRALVPRATRTPIPAIPDLPAEAPGLVIEIVPVAARNHPGDKPDETVT